MEIIAAVLVGWLVLNVAVVLLRMRAVAPRVARATAAAAAPVSVPVFVPGTRAAADEVAPAGVVGAP